MKKNYPLCAWLLCLSLVGCSKPQEEVGEAVPPPPTTPSEAVSLAGSGGEATAPPPVIEPPAAVTAPVTPAPAPSAEADAKIEYQGEDGQTISQIEWLEQMVSGYERMRASDAETPRPALTSIEQLVTYRIVSRLPAPPAGKRFHYDVETGKVSLVAK
jgi:hypothetical protein